MKYPLFPLLAGVPLTLVALWLLVGVLFLGAPVHALQGCVASGMVGLYCLNVFREDVKLMREERRRNQELFRVWDQ